MRVYFNPLCVGSGQGRRPLTQIKRFRSSVRYSRLSCSGGVEEGGDDSSLFSLFPHFLSRSPPLFFTAFFPPRRPTTPLFCSASITRLRSNSVFPCSSINSETFSSPSCLLFHAVFLNVSIIILRDIRYIILYLFK